MVVDELGDADVDLIFHALADATRRDILTRVISHEQSVSALARRYEMSFAAVQKHVAVLERASLVSKQRHGREQIVHGEPLTLRRARRLLDDYEEIWRARARSIEDLLAGDPLGGSVTGPRPTTSRPTTPQPTTPIEGDAQ